MTTDIADKKRGAIYGALIGDATGCPYEFQRPDRLPPFAELEMVPPKFWDKTYATVPDGTYTDDGAQTLCLLETLTEQRDSVKSSDVGRAALISSLREKMKKWLHEGYMSVGNITFDVGSQTRSALLTAKIEDIYAETESNGNGSLMRCIPVAVMADNEEEAISIAMTQSTATHPHMWSQLTCAAYSLIGYWTINGAVSADELIIPAFSLLQRKFPEHRHHLAHIYNHKYNEPNGTGFVIDAFWSALYALRLGTTYKEVIKHAIALGHDTDTTACIAGGLAGIKFGYSGLPIDWVGTLRGKELIEDLVNKAVPK